MENKKTAYITFGSQMGGAKAGDAVQPHLIELRRLLRDHCSPPYAQGIDNFAPILRVDGDIWYWQFEGLQKLRLMKQQRYITVDVGMPRSRWENVPASLIREYLIDNLEMALHLFVDKLRKEKIPVDDKRLFADLAEVRRLYTA